MKKLLSILLTMLLVCSTVVLPATVQASGEESLIITSVNDGNVFEEGSSVILKAETNAAAWSRIEFYANGDKLPGYVTPDGSQVLLWNAQNSGNYALTAKLYYVAGGEPLTSAAVNVVVADKDAYVIFDGKTMTNVSSNKLTGTSVPALDTTMYKVAGSSLGIDLTSFNSSGNDSAYVNFNWSSDDSFLGGYVYSWIYLTQGDIPFFRVVNSDESVSWYYYSLKDGNPALVKPSSTAPTSCIESNGWYLLKFRTANKTPVSFRIQANGGGKNRTYAKYNDKIYVGPVWISESECDDYAPTVTPEISSASEGVCTELKEYRVNFTGQMDVKNMEGKFSVIGGSEELQGVSYEYGLNYAKIKLPTLENGKTYTVKYAGSSDYLGCEVASAQWTFTTMEESCTGATPIPKVVYPANGSKLASPVRLTVDTLFVSKVKSVEFMNSTTSLGIVTEAVGSEWQLDAQLSAGEYTGLKAIVTYTDDATSELAVGNITVAVPSYALNGMSKDITNYFVVNGAFGSNYGAQISIVNAADEATTWYNYKEATDVEKIEFYEDGTLIKTLNDGSTKCNVPLTDLISHNLTVKVYDVFGGIHNFGPYKYQAVYGEASTTITDTFDTSTGYLAKAHSAKSGHVAPALSVDEGALKITPDSTASNRTTSVRYSIDNPKSGIVVISYDLYPETLDSKDHWALGVGSADSPYDTVSSGFNGSNFVLSKGTAGFADKKWYNVKAVVDIDNNTAAFYVDGYLKTVDTVYDLDDKKIKNASTINFDIRPRYTSVARIDNVEVKAVSAISEKVVFVDAKASDSEAEISDGVASGTRVVINNTDDSASFVNIYAVYTEDDKLVDVKLNPVTLKSKGISNVLFDDISIVKDGLTGSDVRLFTWFNAVLCPVTEK